MKTILSLLTVFGSVCTLHAEEAASKVYYPGSASAAAASATPGGSVFVSILYLVFLAGLAWAVYLFWRKRNVPCNTTRDQARILDVTATRPLGNRQFLVVVRYGKKELLLGVGQGFITPLETDECLELSGAQKTGAQV